MPSALADIFQYLNSRKAMPTVEQLPWMEEGLSGRYVRDDNHIQLNSQADIGTMTHEFGHAADHAMRKQYSDRRLKYNYPVEPTQFTDAYRKLVLGDPWERTRPRQDMANKLDPVWTEKNKDYRSQGSELLGWAMGSTANNYQGRAYNPPAHLNPTLATEFSILMDLAQRADTPDKRGFLEKLFSK